MTNEQLYERIQRLELENKTLRAELNQLQQVDWHTMFGRLVEVRNEHDSDWLAPRPLVGYNSQGVRPFKDKFQCWGSAQLYKGPTVPNFIPYKDNTQTLADCKYLVSRGNPSRIAVIGLPNDWSEVTHYTELKVVI